MLPPGSFMQRNIHESQISGTSVQTRFSSAPEEKMPICKLHFRSNMHLPLKIQRSVKQRFPTFNGWAACLGEITVWVLCSDDSWQMAHISFSSSWQNRSRVTLCFGQTNDFSGSNLSFSSPLGCCRIRRSFPSGIGSSQIGQKKSPSFFRSR